ncbi:site-specific DNA-methyltransferase [Paenibacillus sp. EKM202P]|uniref:DNA-methyltransferase n=1 Tax=unclassified Paenibacillus TaxID=185978 RepID=UPI0013ED820B|nr:MULTISPECIES: site-specific DNA-methyltransferase [unclassified Paenibacillus]KAF6565376.1 site-specific DNA-methyltransferase [Paenibacillus sp. EKM202P]KAF6569299.1 site-specific DNA-methyltransferase [Paenibacillus sp. EKM207P]
MSEIEINKIYCMDNMELLKSMPEDSVNLIYSDILYNTGRKFEDFSDNLGTPREAISWYEPRLIEMKRVLKDGGSIFLHCDWHLVHYLKVKMDEIFGLENFRNEIVWRYKRWTARSNSKFQSMHDNILFYAKGNNLLNHQYEDLDSPRLYQNRKDKSGDVIKNEDGSVKYFPQTKRQIDDVWDIPFLNPRAKERVGYDTQKPKELIRRIILAASNEGDVVADFFMGSGTTIEVASEQKRFYIGCDINQKAIDITYERLKKCQ